MRGNCAPWNIVLNPWWNQEKFGGMLLGHPIYLKVKARGEKSMSEKQETMEGTKGVVLQDPYDMAKAILPES